MYGTLLALSLAVADSSDRVTMDTGRTQMPCEQDRLSRLLERLKEIIGQQERIRIWKEVGTPKKAPADLRRETGGPELSCSSNDTPVEDLGKTEQETELQRLVRLLHAHDIGTPFLGLTEQQLRQQLGNPTSVEKGVWYYEEPRGFHDFISQRVVRFANGKVVSAKVERTPVGCIYYVEREP
jgi:hypothetical protein